MTDLELLNNIQYVMIETPDQGASWHSGLWTRDEVLSYLNERQNRFIKNTHIVLTTGSIVVVAGTFRYDLPADWVATARVYWVPATGSSKELTPSDSWEADHGIPTWSVTAGQPKMYMDRDVPTLTIQLAPIPSVNGTVEVMYVASATDLNGAGASLSILDEFMPTLKYGILADMFSKVGRAHDPVRSTYCEQRYQMGEEIAQLLLKGF